MADDNITTSNPEDITAFICDSLQEFSKEKTEELKKIIKKESSECAKQISNDSPKRTGKYAKGWTSSKTDENSFNVTYTVHNTTKPSLTHLLENGYIHANTGKRVVGKPHINQNCEDTGERISEDIKELEGD